MNHEIHESHESHERYLVRFRVFRVFRAFRGFVYALMLVAPAAVFAQTSAREQLAIGHRLWNQRLATSAIAAFEAATLDRATAAEAHEAIGRIYILDRKSTRLNSSY